MNWESRAKEFLEEIVKIYSPSGQEKDLSLYIASFFRELGFENVKTDEVWNVMADVTYGRPMIYLIGHIDTVPGELPVKLKEDKLYGRGVVDAKGAFASFVMASYLLKKEGFRGGLKVVGVVDEEGSGKGIREFGKKTPKPDYAIFGEPTGPNQITVGYKGRIQLSIDVETETYHASIPWIGPNALQEILKAYDAIKNAAFSYDTSKKPGFDSISTCVTILKAGDSINVTPGKAKMTIDMRIPPYVKGKVIAEKLREAILGAGLEGRFRITIEEVTEAYEISAKSPIVRAFKKGIYKVLKKPARLVKKTGTGDMNYYGGVLGVPSVTVGPGNSKLSHTSNEVMDLREYIEYIKVVKESLKELVIADQKRS